jgi:hypothetical protein
MAGEIAGGDHLSNHTRASRSKCRRWERLAVRRAASLTLLSMLSLMVGCTTYAPPQTSLSAHQRAAGCSGPNSFCDTFFGP